MCIDAATINDILRVPNPSNSTFKEKINESKLRWTARHMVSEGKANEVKWSN